jgi:hypothetical protein
LKIMVMKTSIENIFKINLRFTKIYTQQRMQISCETFSLIYGFDLNFISLIILANLAIPLSKVLPNAFKLKKKHYRA